MADGGWDPCPNSGSEEARKFLSFPLGVDKVRAFRQDGGSPRPHAYDVQKEVYDQAKLLPFGF